MTWGLNEDFLDILRALGEAGADYLVVGAHAMAVHGTPRATGDLDLGMSVPFLGREALLKNKRASGRAKDLADLELLEGSG
jgi:hypothetical protein